MSNQQQQAGVELIDPEDGENRAVRAFLANYSAPSPTVERMRKHMTMSGYPLWPEWVEDGVGHLTKGGAQNWLRHLFGLEQQSEAIAADRQQRGKVEPVAQAGEVVDGYRVFLDGDKWCAVGAGFSNIQESLCVFEDTPYLALERLTELEGDAKRRKLRVNNWATPQAEKAPSAEMVEVKLTGLTPEQVKALEALGDDGICKVLEAAVTQAEKAPSVQAVEPVEVEERRLSAAMGMGNSLGIKSTDALKILAAYKSVEPSELIPAPQQPSVPLTDRTFMALQSLTEGILTRGDPDFMRRRLEECIAIMAEHGWQAPVPFTENHSFTALFAAAPKAVEP